jgi:glutamate racemase
LSPQPFDIVFCDTCLGGSTVASRLASTHHGLRAFYLADYAVNPLGVKSTDAVGAALAHWVDVGSALADTIVIACNTASVLFAAMRERGARSLVGSGSRTTDAPRFGAMASSAGRRPPGNEIVGSGFDRIVTAAPGERTRPRTWSMVDFVDVLLRSTTGLDGRRFCLMGTQFTVRHRTYYERLARAGVHDVVPLAATTTERVIAHLEHTRPEGRRAIIAEIGHAVRTCDSVLLACTCFPLIADLIAELNPDCLLLDPAIGISDVLPRPHERSTNRLTIALTGAVLGVDEASRYAHALFPGWEVECIVAASDIVQPPALKLS